MRFTQETSAPWPTWLRRRLFNPALSESSVPVPAADSDPEHRNGTAAASGVDGEERERERKKGKENLCFGEDGILVTNETNCGLFRHLSVSWPCLFLRYFLFNTDEEKNISSFHFLLLICTSGAESEFRDVFIPALLSYLSNSQHQQYKQLLTGSHRSSHDPLLQSQYLQKQDREWITTPSTLSCKCQRKSADIRT